MSWDKEPPKPQELKNAAAWASAPPQDEESDISDLDSFGRGAAQGATFGFADEIAGGGEALWDVLTTDQKLEAMRSLYEKHRNESRENFKKAKDANPWSYGAGEVGGAIASGLALPGGAAGSIGRMAATGAALGGLSGLGASEATGVGGLAKDTLVGAGLGGALGAGAGKLAQVVARQAEKAAPVIGGALKRTPSANRAEVEAAAQRLGVKPTQAMLFEDEAMNGVESSLHRSPSIAGYMMRKETMPVAKRLESVAGDALADATDLSPFELGETVKKGITENVGARLKAAGEPFEEIAANTRHMVPNEKSLGRVANNIRNLDEVQLTQGSPWAEKAAKYADWLENVENVDQIKRLRGILRQDMESAQGPEKFLLSQIYDRFTRIEENSIMRNTVDTFRSFAKKPTGATGDKMAAQGEQAALDTIKKFRTAKTEYAKLANDLRGVADQAGLGNLKSPHNFAPAVDGIRSERVVEKLFNTGDQELLQRMQAQFPREFELLRQGKLAELSRKASTADGEISRVKFFNAIKNMGDDTAEMVFGKQNVQNIGDAKTLSRALPREIGPSGTPEGMQYLNMLNPAMQTREMGRYALYKFLGSDVSQEVADYLLKNPRFQKMALENPKAFKVLASDFSRKVTPRGPRQLPRVAGEGGELDRDSSRSSQQRPVNESEAQRRFLEGN